MKTLIAPTFVTVAGWSAAYEFNTARGYAAQYGEDQEQAHERCRYHGHDTAWSMNLGSAILANRAWSEARNKLEAARLAGAAVLTEGEAVEIEGETFTVKINGERFADPISFVRA